MISLNIDGRREAAAIEAISVAIQAILDAPVENETKRAALKVLEGRTLPPKTTISHNRFYGHTSPSSLPGDEDDGEVNDDD